MAGKEIIVVFGATGAQGNSVACALLEDCTFAVRAVTRDPSKPAAAKLKQAGAEVVAGDLDNEKSLEAALKGAHGAFLVTNTSGQHADHNKEVTQGKLVADLAKRLGLKHIVYSGLENVKKLTGGKLGAHHFDVKGEVEEYFRHIGCHMTSVRLSFYYENFLGDYKPQKCEDGKCYALNLPMGDVPLDGISVKDLGPCVVSILKHPSHYGGKNIGLSAEKLTVAQYAHIMSEVTGKTIKDAKIHHDDFEKRMAHGAKHMADMFRFYMTRPERDVEVTHKLNPKVKAFRPWLEENKAAFCKECKE
ncbi:nmrA-like family domain-containing protein 1 [Rana temporaria]|uniref:nmrA-like family domain-containing protein 1 n=1 Tax=Rana temporaria TaxID=8407 RepID=UPI001AAC956E|nr:nmrA-like family domain-containing protein 1 [Rana temporaria]